MIGTIIDNDATAGTPVIRISDPVVDEAANEAMFAITLDRPSASTVTVSYATATGTAGSGDFTAVSGVASFAPGETAVTVPVAIVDDALAEADESVRPGAVGPGERHAAGSAGHGDHRPQRPAGGDSRR